MLWLSSSRCWVVFLNVNNLTRKVSVILEITVNKKNDSRRNSSILCTIGNRNDSADDNSNFETSKFDGIRYDE